jgi:TatD DNase family protein
MSENLPVRGFDLHCHIDLYPDPAATIASCDDNQIVTLAVTTTPKAWPQNRRWTAQSRYVHVAIGLHPEVVAERYREITLLEECLKETPFVGEIGLDGSPQHRKSWSTQTEVFVRALSGAQQLGARVLSIHSRRAADDVLKCINQYTTPDRVLPILHWFSGPMSVANQAATLGCYFSINHRMFEHDSGIRMIRNLPEDRLLTETDAPFTRIGERPSEPHDVMTTAEELARIRGSSVQRISEAITANARRVFAFAEIDSGFKSTS